MSATMVQLLFRIQAILASVLQPVKQCHNTVIQQRRNTAPGYWLLTAGGALVLIVLLRGVISGAGKAKAKAAAQGSRRRR